MFRIPPAGAPRCSRTLFDLIHLRGHLRRQEFLLRAVLQDVRSELAGWRQHRSTEAAAGRPVPRELDALWQELVARERELGADLLQVRAALAEVAAEVRLVLRAQRASRPGRAARPPRVADAVGADRTRAG